MGKILGIDFGKSRIGLALSDPSKTLASPYKTVTAKKTLEQTIETLLKEIAPFTMEGIVIGLPLLLSGKDSEITKEVRAFACKLETYVDIPITLWDERLTSKQVERVLREGEVQRKKQVKYIDRLSATLILQSFLDAQSYSI